MQGCRGWRRFGNRDNIGDKAGISEAIFSHRYRSFVDVAVIEEGGFHFCQFHPVPSDFHLRVFAPKVNEASVRQFAAEIARAIHAASRVVWIGNKYGVRQSGLAPITGAHVWAFDGNFTRSITFDRLAVIVQQNNVGVIH